MNSSLEKIYIPKKVARIDRSAFSECSIKHIKFEESKLREITIQKRVRRINDSAFFFCGHLKSFIINEESDFCEIDKSSLFYGSTIDSICVPSCVELKKRMEEQYVQNERDQII